MSERLSFSSTKYGPSVCSGLITHAGIVVEFAFDDAGSTLECGCAELDFLGMQTTSIVAPTALNRASAFLRLKIQLCWRSLSIMSKKSVEFLQVGAIGVALVAAPVLELRLTPSAL